MWKDLMRVCDDLQIPLTRPAIFPQNGLLAARVATKFSESPWVSNFIRAVYSANFEHNQEELNRCAEKTTPPMHIFSARASPTTS